MSETGVPVTDRNGLHRRRLAALVPLLAACMLLGGLPVAPERAESATKLTTRAAKSAVKKHVRRKFGRKYRTHPTCYRSSRRRGRCFVHLVNSSSSKTCTRWASVKLRRGRPAVSMRRPGC